MPKSIDKRGRIRGGKARELYDDGDSEQKEGVATPRDEPARDAALGKEVSPTTERPGKMAENRPQPDRSRARS